MSKNKKATSPKLLKIPEFYTTESLLQFFSKNKEKFEPCLLVILLHKLSHSIPNKALPQHKASLLEIIQLSKEFETQYFDTVSIATFFNALSKWPSLIADPLCIEVINSFLPAIINRAYGFQAQSISNIFNLLSKYPPLTDSTHSESFKEAINTLLTYIPKQGFSSQDILLVALAFCYFTHFDLIDFDSHQRKIIELLKVLNLKALSPIAINQLQQVFIYAPNLIKSALGNLSSQYLESLYTLEQPSSSLLHKEVFRYLKKCFPSIFINNAFINEYRIGHTFVDIACPKERVCIQVNGPDHYIRRGTEEYLNNRSQFTQFLLQKQGWTVLNIKYTDWQYKNRDEKRVYLREVIGPYLKTAEPQPNLTEQEQTMPSYLVMQQQLETQKQLLEIQKQLLEIQKQQLVMPQSPPQPYYSAPTAQPPHQQTPASLAIPSYYPYPVVHPIHVWQPLYQQTPIYSAIPSYYPYPAAPVYNVYYPIPTAQPPYQTQSHFSVPAPDLTTQPSPQAPLGNAVNYDQHTNLFKPLLTQQTGQSHSKMHFSPSSNSS